MSAVAVARRGGLGERRRRDGSDERGRPGPFAQDLESSLSASEQEARRTFFERPRKAPYEKVAIYCRISTIGQKYASIESQQRKGHAVAAKIRKDVHKVYIEHGRSAKDTNRPVFKEMMADAADGRFGGVIAVAYSRYSRNLEDGVEFFQALDKLDIEVFEKDFKHDKYTAAANAIYADKDRSERTNFCSQGRKDAAREGRVPHPPAYGHEITPGEPGRHRRHPHRGMAIKLIFRLLDGGASARHVSDMLNRNGKHPSPGAERLRRRAQASEKAGEYGQAAELRKRADRALWTAGAVLHQAKNPAYKGIVVYGRKREKKEGLVFAPTEDLTGAANEEMGLVADGRWGRVQANVEGRALSGGHSARTMMFPGRGLVICGRCGGTMSRQGMEKKHFKCKSFDRRTNARCVGCGAIRADLVEQAMIDELRRLFVFSGLRDVFRRNYDRHIATITAQGDRQVAEARRALDEAMEKSRYYREEKRQYLVRTGETIAPDSLEMDVETAFANEREAKAVLRGREDERERGAKEARLDNIEAAIADLERILSQSGEGVDGGRLAAAINVFFVSITVAAKERLPGELNVTLTLKTRIPADLSHDGDARITAEGCWTTQENTIVCNQTAIARKALAAEQAVRRAGVEETARAGTHRISDTAFAIAEPHCRSVDLTVDGVGVPLRALLDAMVFAARTRTGLSNLPSSFGDKRALDKVARRLVFSRSWDRTVEAWMERSPGDLLGLQAGAVAFAGLPRTKAKAQPTHASNPSPQDLRDAISTKNGVAANLRLVAVARCKEGEARKAVARSLGVSGDAVKLWCHRVRVDGIGGLMSHPKKPRLSAEQVESSPKPIAPPRIPATVANARSPLRRSSPWPWPNKCGGYATRKSPCGH